MASNPRLSNENEHSIGAHPSLRLARGVSIEGVLGDFIKIVEEKGIDLRSVKFVRAKLKREFEFSGISTGAGGVCDLDIGVEGGQTHLIVRFRDPMNDAVVCDLEYAAHLAAHRMELLAGRALRTDEEGQGRGDRSPVIDGLIGESEVMGEVREEIVTAAGLDLSVLITGEPGTGKELAARGIHNAGSRAGKPFIAVNSAAINPNLIESELFGHEKGAFTGASARKIGRFELANGGTLFLDEIGDLPTPSQAMLLRVLQERELERVGGTQTIKIDIHLVAATNHDLRREVDEGHFRRDLYDRLSGYPIRMPSLKEHPTDIPLLIRHYIREQLPGLDLTFLTKPRGSLRIDPLPSLMPSQKP